MEDVRADDPRHRERVDEHHHEPEVRAAADRSEPDDEAEDRAGRDRDQLVAAGHDERSVARLHAAFHQRLREEAAAAADQRGADGIAEDRLCVADLVSEHPGNCDAGDRERPRAGEQPQREVAVHRAETPVADRPERLEDRAVEDVGADRVGWLEAEEDDQDRRHQRAAADPCQADDQPEQQPREGELPGHDALSTMPAPTVSFVASSMRTKDPVARFSA